MAIRSDKTTAAKLIAAIVIAMAVVWLAANGLAGVLTFFFNW
jgi:hypothetical protein